MSTTETETPTQATPPRPPSRLDDPMGEFAGIDEIATVTTSDTVMVIEPRLPGIKARMVEFWRNRRLIPYFGRRAVDKIASRTVLGRAWLALRPFFLVSSQALIFGGLLAAPSEGKPYFLFFLVGMTAWRLFDRILWYATRSIDMNRRLLRKIYLPRIVLPFAGAAPGFFEFLTFMVLTILAYTGFGIVNHTFYLPTNADLLLAPLALLLASLLGLGISLWTSVGAARAKDVRLTLRYVSDFWMFLTPVIYPLSQVPKGIQPIVELNPMTSVVEMFKEGMLGAGQVTGFGITVTCVWIVVAWTTGLWFFDRAEAAGIDRL